MQSDQSVKRCLQAIAAGAAAILPWMISMSLVSSVAANPSPYPTEYKNPLEVLYQWKHIEFTYPSAQEKSAALASGAFIPNNSLPLGIGVWKDRIFVSTPKWKPGIPVSLSTVPRHPYGNTSPSLDPYPGWSWHQAVNGSCDVLFSVTRVSIDCCGRLWAIDGGNKMCPPQIFVFDLNNDTLLRKYVIPTSQIKESSSFLNIVTDDRNNQCDNTHAYVMDTARPAVVVYSWKDNKSRRVEHPYFGPDPTATNYYFEGINVRITDGISSIALGPVTNYSAEHPEGDRTVYFSSLSSNWMFCVSASVLQSGPYPSVGPDKFTPIGRRRDNGQCTGSAIDSKGVMYYNQVSRDAVWCWNTNLPYQQSLLGAVKTGHKRLKWPNDLRVDHEKNQSVWMLSNKLPTYFFGKLDSNEYNFRIWTALTSEATRGTVCDPDYVSRTRTWEEHIKYAYYK